MFTRVNISVPYTYHSCVLELSLVCTRVISDQCALDILLVGTRVIVCMH